jgi:hypothetical protein
MSQEEETPQEQDPEQSDQATPSEESPASDAAEEAVASEEVNRPPFAIRAGAEISYGKKTGRVKTIRGNGAEPYEVGIQWAGDQHPVWLLYRALKGAYEQGHLQINS